MASSEDIGVQPRSRTKPSLRHHDSLAMDDSVSLDKASLTEIDQASVHTLEASFFFPFSLAEKASLATATILRSKFEARASLLSDKESDAQRSDPYARRFGDDGHLLFRECVKTLEVDEVCVCVRVCVRECVYVCLSVNVGGWVLVRVLASESPCTQLLSSYWKWNNCGKPQRRDRIRYIDNLCWPWADIHDHSIIDIDNYLIDIVVGSDKNTINCELEDLSADKFSRKLKSEGVG